MEPTEFIATLGSLSTDDLRHVADEVRRGSNTADGELAWWRATVRVSSALRRSHRSREAGLFAHRAVEAVQAAAVRGGLAEEREVVTTVARAAAEVARALVADSDVDHADAPGRTLLAPWMAHAPSAA